LKLFQLGQLFALPLQAAVRAQSLALQETFSFLEEFGTEAGAARTFSLRTERMVEERRVDPATGEVRTEFKKKPLEISLPLLALLPPPVMRLREMDVEFGVEVVEPRSEPLKSTLIPEGVVGSSLAPTLALFSPPDKSNPTTIRVKMKIRSESPEGMSRLGDLLADMLSGRDLAATSKKPSPELRQLRGINARRAELLSKRGISTVDDLLSATESREGVKEVARIAGVSERRILAWRKKAKLLTEGEKKGGE
jgi:predicted flap endonuclease-1-like 5' DNA nuclease